MGFQAVIKSAASAASLGPRKNPNIHRKNREKMKEKLPFGAFYIGNPISHFECLPSTVFQALARQGSDSGKAVPGPYLAWQVLTIQSIEKPIEKAIFHPFFHIFGR